MLIINTIDDFVNAEASAERTAFLDRLLNDFVTFDDAVYPDDYDSSLKPGDAGYVEPVIRKEWNAGAAAAWSFISREHIERTLDGYVRARDEQGRYVGDDPATPDVNEAWVKA